MTNKIEIKYPHGITVIGKITNDKRPEEALIPNTRNSFQIWLDHNYSKNNLITLGMSMLSKTKEEWEKSAKTHYIKKSYEEHLDMLKTFEGRTIEVTIGEE